MSHRLSMVAGTISFVAVAVLSALSLDMVEGRGFFMQVLLPVEAGSPALDADSPDADSPKVEGDSTRLPSTENRCR